MAKRRWQCHSVNSLWKAHEVLCYEPTATGSIRATSFFKQLIHQLRAGLTLGRLHYLSDKKPIIVSFPHGIGPPVLGWPQQFHQ